MGFYVSSRRPPLGLTTGQTALISTGANAVIPGSGPLVAVSLGVLNNLFSGGARDEKRKAREEWFEQAARQGSPLAGRVMIGGTQNTGGNEIPYYRDGINRLLADPRTAPTMAAAQAAGAYWDSTDNETSDKMRAAVENELRAIAQVVDVGSSIAPSSSSSSGPSGSSNATMLPAMRTTAAFNWWPWALGAAGLGLAVFVVPRIIAPSRRR